MSDRGKFGTFIGLLILVFLLFSIWVDSAHSREIRDLSGDIRYSLEETRQALVYAKETRDTWAKLDIEKLANAFFETQEEYSLPSLFLISIGWHESRYRLGAEGKLKELGIMQVAPRGRRICSVACGAMATEREEVRCGGCWLQENIKWCKTFRKGFNGYATGKCNPPMLRSKQRIVKRFYLWRSLDNYVIKGEK